MYLINKLENNISKLEEKTFGESGISERNHLQEWLAGNPEALGEELLIIQKEFDGFKDTYERLDLLAIDKQGDLVIIENKLDDSGRDVTWQALKYASYCSSLSKEEIKQIYQNYLDKQNKNVKAEQMLSTFFDNIEYEEISLNSGNTQRIIMVAGRFRKEVTSTVLWLMNFKIRIQCFKVTPLSYVDQLFLNIEQILPIQDAEELTVGFASKTQDEVAVKKKKSELNTKRFAFWSGLLEKAKRKLPLFRTISPTHYNWIGTSSGLRGVTYTFWITKDTITLRLYIDRGKDGGEENLLIFNELLRDKASIEELFGEPLVWQELKNYRSCTIMHEIKLGGYADETKWNEIQEQAIEAMIRMEKAFKSHIAEIKLN